MHLKPLDPCTLSEYGSEKKLKKKEFWLKMYITKPRLLRHTMQLKVLKAKGMKT